MKKTFAYTLCSLGLITFSSSVMAQEFKPGQTVEDNRVVQPGDNDNQGRGSSQSSSGQRGSSQSSQSQTQSTPGSVQASNLSGQQGQSGQHGQQLQHILVRSLIQKNQGEVEMGQLAQQHSQNQEVKEFAQHMIQSHTQLIQEMQGLNTGSASSQGATSGAQGQSSRSTQGSTSGSDSAESGNTRAGGSDSSANPGGVANRSGQGDSSAAGQSGSTTTQSRQQGGSQAGQQGLSGVDSQLAAVMQEACEKHQQLTREMLTQYKGSEFDMAYIGQQIAAHTLMKADLQAVSDKGDQQFQQLAKKALTETEKHLQMAQSIANNLKGQNNQR